LKRSARQFTLVVTLLTLPVAVCAGSYMDSAGTSLLTQVQENIYNGRFRQAESLAVVYMDTHSEDPAGYLCQAVVLTSEMFDREENLYEKQLFDLLDTVLARSAKIMDTTSPTVCSWMHLYTGHAYAYRALWEAHFGSLIKAIKLGHQAKEEYERGLLCDSSLYDLYFGLGLYHYWKSAKAGLLRSVGLFEDERDRGLAELQLAADSSVISRESARGALIWIQLDRGKYDSVVSVCREMLKKYPDGNTFLWPLAEAYLEKGNYRNGRSTLQLLRDRLAVEPGNYFNLVECDYYLYYCYEKLSMKSDAEQLADETMQYYQQIPQRTRGQQRDKIAFLKRASKM
jgi:hypothetical protein